MQNLYVITIFLNRDILNYMDHVFTGIDTESVSYTHFKTYDENGEKAEAREFIVSGVSILLIATTQYNKNMDFQIGITFEKQDEWDKFVDFTKKNESDYEFGEDNDFSFVVTSKEDIHSPFFFIYDRNRPIHSNYKLECQLPEKEFSFCDNLINNYIHSDIENNIILTVSNDNVFMLNSLEISLENNIINEFEFSYKNIFIEIRDSTFKIMLNER